MNQNFWHQKWEENDIGFHREKVNPFLEKFFNLLLPHQRGRVFVPLCGKTVDISWLLKNGCSVIGVELSSIAIEQLFNDLKVSPTITKGDSFLHYSAPQLDIYCGNIFDMTKSLIGQVNAVYDRAALVALPYKTRKTYTSHVIKISENASQLLVTYEYNQTLVDGPPFSVDSNEVHEHFLNSYTITLLESRDVPGGMKGKCDSTESAWLLESSS